MPAWPAPWLRSRYGPAGASPASAQARRLGRSKHHFHKRVRGECLVQVIELLAAGGCHRDGDTQVFAAAAGAQLDGAGVKSGVEALGDLGDFMHQMLGL